MCPLFENIYLIAEKEIPLSCREKCQGGKGVEFLRVLSRVSRKASLRRSLGPET